MAKSAAEKAVQGGKHLGRVLKEEGLEYYFGITGGHVFPMQVEAVLMGIPEVGVNYQIVLETQDFMDVMTVKVEMRGEVFTGDVKGLQDLQHRITTALKSELLFTPHVTLVEPGSFPEAQGKAVRVIDHRMKEKE